MDIKLITDSNGQFTLGIKNGDFTLDDGFDSAINISLFTDARALDSQVLAPENRRGWLGDLVSLVKGRKTGSLLWIFDMSRLNLTAKNKIVDAAQKSLNWIVEDGLANSVTVSGEIVPRKGIRLNINITAISGEITSRYIELWELTGNAA